MSEENVEIEALSDDDLDTVSGGVGEACSVGCTQSYTCQCGTGSCCTACPIEPSGS